MKGIVEIPKSDGMLLMRGVTNLETGTVLDSVVIRGVERLFWSECVNQVMTPDMVRRVCAVGTPGTGKTTSTVFLIRTLFENKHTVVYRFASEPYYWEFKWRPYTGGYDVNVYTQEHSLWDVESLIDPRFTLLILGIRKKTVYPTLRLKPGQSLCQLVKTVIIGVGANSPSKEEMSKGCSGFSPCGTWRSY